MTTPLSEIQRPDAQDFKQGRKLYLVPLFLAPPDAPAELQEKLEQYWAGAQEHIARLEAAWGPSTAYTHETVFLPGRGGGKAGRAAQPRRVPGNQQQVRGRSAAGSHGRPGADRGDRRLAALPLHRSGQPEGLLHSV